MKKLYFLLFTFLIASASFGQDLLITGAFDGPLTGGTPKGVELYVVNDIADLSIYGIGSANNGGGTDGEEYTFPADAVTAGTFLYVASEATQFTNFFGFAPTYNAGSAMGINGDDAVELFQNGTVTDVFGDINTDGTGEAWDHLDGWGYRVDGTGPDGTTFTLSNWTFSGINQLEGGATNAACTSPFPIGTYSPTASTTPTINVGVAVSGLDYFEGNGPSASGTLTVSGLNLTAGILVSAPQDFELSLDDATFTPTVTVTQTGGTAASTTVYVRLTDGLAANTYSGDAIATSAGATDKTVALSGTVSPAVPQMTITGFVGDLDYEFDNGPSNEDSFNVEGLFLTENILVSAPTNFEVSLTTGAGFASSVSVPFGSGTVASTEIFVRLVVGLAVGPYSGDVTASSAGATNQTITISGNVTPAATCSNVGDIIITEVMQNPSASGNDPAGEYFELYNTTGAPIDMAGWKIKDEASATETHTISSSLIVPAGGYIVIGNVATTTPALDYNYANDISLGNSTDGLILECSATTIDAVTWDNGNTFPDPTGASMELSINALNSIANDTGANWGTAITDIGNGDLGSPGAANDFTLSTNQFDINNFNVYPNPTDTGIVTINSSNNELMKVRVFDILGKQVLESTLNNNQLNVSSLNAGVYILRLTQNNTSVTKKLVIQ